MTGMATAAQRELAAAWRAVEAVLPHAKLIAWDGCHKMYLAMDEHEAGFFRERDDYQTATGTPEDLLATLHTWWDESCWLRFINSVRHTEPDPNEGFVDLIPQFCGVEDEED